MTEQSTNNVSVTLEPAVQVRGKDVTVTLTGKFPEQITCGHINLVVKCGFTTVAQRTASLTRCGEGESYVATTSFPTQRNASAGKHTGYLSLCDSKGREITSERFSFYLA
ncbi:hypothetical protein OG897_31305 [Streptomyces sp. NBC_00237]|uniref:hypothetical protein n=1 Tax=Streptomyces sp. NBC_00237 TaxID=2975687 RepID=UPI00225057E9|nr:hypothetical protein [Streptomyces sp. NBC_00237]MCX5205904.1 hypothetical protein [Streptomyces sp. NBC_00237]